MNPYLSALLLLLAGGGGVEIIRFILSRFDHSEDLETKIRGELRGDNIALREQVGKLSTEVQSLRETNVSLKAEMIALRAENSDLRSQLGALREILRSIQPQQRRGGGGGGDIEGDRINNSD